MTNKDLQHGYLVWKAGLARKNHKNPTFCLGDYHWWDYMITVVLPKERKRARRIGYNKGYKDAEFAASIGG